MKKYLTYSVVFLADFVLCCLMVTGAVWFFRDILKYQFLANLHLSVEMVGAFVIVVNAARYPSKLSDFDDKGKLK